MPMHTDDILYKTLLDEIRDGVYFVDSRRRITYWNKGSEALTGFSSSDVLGKDCGDSILNHIDDAGNELCKTDCPLSLTLADGKKRTCSLFMHHRSGKRIPIEASVSPIRDETGKIIGALEVFKDNTTKLEYIHRIEELKKEALTDACTKIPNRRFLDMKLSSAFNELKRFNVSFGVLLIDLDDFKRINDTYGHDIGDQVLAAVAGTLSSNCRSTDLVGRWGGEEFLAVVTHVDAESLEKLAEKFRFRDSGKILRESHRYDRSRFGSCKRINSGTAEQIRQTPLRGESKGQKYRCK
jgi:diguanylate cyclase (GGDEF)-like protein/PAS domain S-box-containing protein